MSRVLESGGVYRRHCDYCNKIAVQKLNGVDLCPVHTLFILAEMEDRMQTQLIQRLRTTTK